VLQGGAAVGAGAFGLSLVGCGDDSDDGDSTPTESGSTGTASATQQASPEDDQVDTEAELKVGFGSFPSTLDVQTAAGQGGQAASNGTHFGSAFDYTPQREIIAGFASFEFRENNSIYRMTAKPNVKFHDGEVLNAEVLKFNFDRILGRAEYNPDFQGANTARAAWMGDITIVDEMSIDIAMDPPFVDAAEQSGGINFPVVPRQYIIDNGDEHFAQNPVGCGPMVFESWTPDQEIRSVRFDDYFFPRDAPGSSQAPWIKTLVGRFIPEEQARLAALEAGEIDIAYRIGPDLAKAFQDREDYNVVILPDVRVMSLELPISWTLDPRTGEPNPWRDIRVRQAANYAIDVDAIVQNLLTGTEERAYPPFPGGYDLPLGSLEEPYSFDPQRARTLLEEAGAVGFEFEILLATGLWTGDRIWGPAIQQMLNDVGFNVSVNYMPLSEALTLMRNHETQGPFVFNQGSTRNGAPLGALFAYQLVNTVDAPYSHTTSGDDLLPEHAEFQSVVEQANQEFDAERRNDLFHDAATILYENAFTVPLFNLSHLYVTAKNITYSEYFDTPTGMNLMAVKKLRA
jgi:peptide/nickel transport system substrate-binding protein